jgi:nucleoid-associated protein EbfC
MAFGQQPNMQQILKQAQQMQEQLMAAQSELAEARVDGSAGGGLVRATVSGSGELIGLTIDPEALDPDDTDTLADLVLAAVRDATSGAARLQQEKMGPLTEGLGGMGMPGLGGVGR